MIQFDKKWYKTVSFWVILKLYHYMLKFSIYTLNDIKLIHTGAKTRLCYVNWDSVWKTRRNWYFVCKTSIKWSQIMTVHICNFNIKMFSNQNLNNIFPSIVFFIIIMHQIKSISNHILLLFVSPILASIYTKQMTCLVSVSWNKTIKVSWIMSSVSGIYICRCCIHHKSNLKKLHHPAMRSSIINQSV
jgi:hypothetical protein